MNDTVSLTIKINPALKETLKTHALEKQISLSQEVTQRLQSSLTTLWSPAVDNQDLAKEVDPQLTSTELKQIRVLLKKAKKKK